jgi:hypothetical protein
MSLPGNIKDREHDKFEEVDSQTTVKVSLFGGLQIPSNARFLSVDYPADNQEVYTYKSSEFGDTLKTVVVNYLDASKRQISSVSW